MNKNNFWKVIIILVVLVASPIAYFGFNREGGIDDASYTPPPYEPTKEEILRLEKLKSWETYKNEKYGFEFKYPKDWIIEEKLGKELGFNYATDEEKKLGEESVYVYLKKPPYEWRLIVYSKLTEGMAKSGKLIKTKEESPVAVDGLYWGFYRDNILEDVPHGPGKLLQVCKLKERLPVGSPGDKVGYDASCNLHIKSGKTGIDNSYRVEYFFEEWEEYSGVLDVRKGTRDKEAVETMDLITKTFNFAPRWEKP